MTPMHVCLTAISSRSAEPLKHELLLGEGRRHTRRLIALLAAMVRVTARAARASRSLLTTSPTPSQVAMAKLRQTERPPF